MRIIEPVSITDAMLISSNVSEDSAASWDVGVAYAVGQQALIPETHEVYEALAANAGKFPPDNPTEWQSLGASNRWRMFDARVGSSTAAADAVSVVIQPGLVYAVALIGVAADSVTVSMTDAVDGMVFEKTVELQDTSVVKDWFSYFFEPIRRRETVVIDGLPAYRNGRITVTASAPGAEARVGELVVGRVHDYAPAFRYGAALGLQDYSRKERDPWGNAIVVERDYARTGRWSVLVRSDRIDDLIRTLARLRARPAVYIGSARWDASVVYGFLRDFDVVISYPTYSELAIELEGLT